jgi:hypothetical protein
MFTSYLPILITSLKHSYPLLADKDATDLMLKGILALDLSVNPKTGEFSSAIIDQVIGNSGSSRGRIYNTYQRFVTTSSGTPCASQ